MFVGYSFGAKGYKVLILPLTRFMYLGMLLFMSMFFPFPQVLALKIQFLIVIQFLKMLVFILLRKQIIFPALRKLENIPYNDVDTLFTDHNSMSTQSPNTSCSSTNQGINLSPSYIYQMMAEIVAIMTFNNLH